MGLSQDSLAAALAPHLELMSQAANDGLFLADLNATMEDFKDADHLEQLA